MSAPKRNTVVFILKDDQVLLGMKKRGFGAGWWNGFGGKLDPGETFEASARRETLEESGLTMGPLTPVARLLFYFEDQLEIACLAYICREFSGKLRETEEMLPKWFDLGSVPYDTMWPGDDQWIPQALDQKPTDPVLNFAIYFDQDKQFQRIEEPADSAVLSYFKEES